MIWADGQLDRIGFWFYLHLILRLGFWLRFPKEIGEIEGLIDRGLRLWGWLNRISSRGEVLGSMNW